MRVRSGIDIVSMEEFTASVRRSGDAFLEKIFSPAERAGSDVQRLAGMFAAKEAAMKAFGMPPGSWHAITVSHGEDGSPAVSVERAPVPFSDCSVSISHAGGFAVAMCVVLVP